MKLRGWDCVRTNTCPYGEVDPYGRRSGQRELVRTGIPVRTSLVGKNRLGEISRPSGEDDVRFGLRRLARGRKVADAPAVLWSPHRSAGHHGSRRTDKTLDVRELTTLRPLPNLEPRRFPRAVGTPTEVNNATS
jgi:hypothetical protein